MAAIKRFFQKRKLDVKFKRAGEGHALNEERAAPSTSPRDYVSGEASARSRGPGEESKKAAEAALARQTSRDKDKQGDPMMAAKARMRREMEAEKKKQAEAEAIAQRYRDPQEVVQDSVPMAAILFKCPEIGEMVLPKDEMETYIHEFLLTQLAEEPEMSSALMIYTLNKDKEQIKVCVDTLCKYMDNIIANPTEEKFRKIRLSNKAFKERVSALKGTEEFMQAAGFQLKSLPFEDHEENFYIMDEDMAKDSDRLKSIKDVLQAAEPIKPQLDRALKIFHPCQSASKFTIPNEFYTIAPEELKKEQQQRQEAVEKLGMLRTKAMRERDEQRELRKYRYALMRVRMPDGVLLQGTFKANEKLLSVFEYVRENLTNDWMPFMLCMQTGQKLTETNKTLAELGLTPAAVVNLEWDKSIMADVTAQQGASQQTTILKPEVMALIQDIN